MGERGENASMFVIVGKNNFLSFVCSCDGDTGCEGEAADARTGMGERCDNSSMFTCVWFFGVWSHTCSVFLWEPPV
jgi:hypothetical protein